MLLNNCRQFALSLLMCMTFTLTAFSQFRLIELDKTPTGFVRKQEPAVQNASVTLIPVDNHIFIKGMYYDTKKDPVAIYVTLKNEFDLPVTSYLAGVFDNTNNQFRNGVPITLYGPQFYEGYERLKMSITVLQLRSETYDKLANRIKTYNAKALSLIPAVGQVTSYINMGLDILKEEVGNDKVHELGTIVITRTTKVENQGQPNQNIEPVARGQWYIVGKGKLIDSLVNASNNGFGHTNIEGNLFPAMSGIDLSKSDGRAMTIGLYRDESPNTSYETVLSVLNQIRQTTADRLKNSPIKPADISTNEAVMQEMAIRQIANAFWARVEVGSINTQHAVTQLVYALNKARNENAEAQRLGLILTPENEQRMIKGLNGIFSFKLRNPADQSVFTVDPIKDQGFRNLQLWVNWLENRMNFDTAIPAPNTRNIIWTKDPGTGKYATVNDEYARKKAQAVFDAAFATSPTDLPQMKNTIGKLKDFNNFFAESNNDWMLFEKKSVAVFINNNFDWNLRQIDLTSDAEAVSVFGKELAQKLQYIDVIEKDGNKWKSPSLADYLVREFMKSVRQGINNRKDYEANHNAIVVEKYNSEIRDKILSLPANKRAEIFEKLDVIFQDQDLVNNKLFSERGAEYVWSNFLFSVVNLGSNQIRLRVEDNKLLPSIQFYENAYKTNGNSVGVARPGDVAGAEELKQIKDRIMHPLRLRELSNRHISAGSTFAERQRVVDFITKFVPQILEVDILNKTPSTIAEFNAWVTKFNRIVPQLRWEDTKFVLNANNEENQQIDDIKSEFEGATPNFPPNNFRSLLTSLIELAFDKPNLAPETRQRAFNLLKMVVVIPGPIYQENGVNLSDSRKEYWTIYMNENLDWGPCKKVFVVGKQNCPPIST